MIIVTFFIMQFIENNPLADIKIIDKTDTFTANQIAKDSENNISNEQKQVDATINALRKLPKEELTRFGIDLDDTYIAG